MRRAGAPNDASDVAQPVSLEIEPKQMELETPGGTRQMKATARYSDGDWLGEE